MGETDIIALWGPDSFIIGLWLGLGFGVGLAAYSLIKEGIKAGAWIVFCVWLWMKSPRET